MAASPSELVRLDPADARAMLGLYRGSAAFFPLIGAVLAGDQDGLVYADRRRGPRQVYAEHAFGFAQAFGQSLPGFEAALHDYLLVNKSFAAAKVRLYTPQFPSFLAGPDAAPLCSERRRFTITPEGALPAPRQKGDLDVVEVDAGNFRTMEQAFGVASRFWRGPAEFLAGAHAVVVRVDGKPAAICYAAGVCDARAEIDVLTLPAYRQRGAARFAVAHFVQRCFRQGIAPLWDCFTNNQGSVQLCLSVGFIPAGPAYPFFTIGK